MNDQEKLNALATTISDGVDQIQRQQQQQTDAITVEAAEVRAFIEANQSVALDWTPLEGVQYRLAGVAETGTQILSDLPNIFTPPTDGGEQPPVLGQPAPEQPSTPEPEPSTPVEGSEDNNEEDVNDEDSDDSDDSDDEDSDDDADEADGV